MRLYTLIENTTVQPSLAAEHGLSLYIEVGGKRLLFDTGASGAMADNAVRMGVDLSQVDALILSHGHYDHGGGLERFLACNATAPVYLSRDAFGGYYNRSGDYIGLDRSLENNRRLVFLDETQELFEGVTVYSAGAVPMKFGGDHAGLQVMAQGRLLPDSFSHELYLMIQEGEKRICFSGCAHRGVRNILSAMDPNVWIGGFHFKHLEPGAPELQAAAEHLMDYGCTYYTCHCTGQDQFEYLKQRMGDRLHRLSTGIVLEI